MIRNTGVQNFMELLTVIIMNIFLKVIVAAGIFYLLKWFCSEMDVKTVLFLYIAVAIGMASKFVIKFRK